ncbi:enoyl-CoA hydratase/isomerase family protein [Nocardia sp. NPDC055029]
MTDSLVREEFSNGVATLTLNRPDKLNALTAEVFTELRRHLDRLAADPAVRCLVLTGAGRSFCAGHDLSVISDGSAADSRYQEAETVDALENFPHPTIAKIHGHCLTGGLELALGCDFLVAAESAQLGDTHSRWGLVPVWGMSVRLPERVGLARAKQLSFSSRIINGTTAASIGLVDRCVSDDALDDEVDTLVREMLDNSAGSNVIYKALYARYRQSSREEALRGERDLIFGMPEDTAARLERAGR